MENTKVVRIRRSKGVITQDCDIYIGRACNMGGWRLPKSKWHNPFTVKEHGITKCLELYEAHIRNSGLFSEIGELEGKTLGCWCEQQYATDDYGNTSEGCHGQVLVRLLGQRKFILETLDRLLPPTGVGSELPRESAPSCDGEIASHDIMPSDGSNCHFKTD